MSDAISKLQRYDLLGEYDPLMLPFDDGDYVRYADLVEALQSGEPVVDADAKREAESLAMALWRKWYKDDSPNFELCDSVAGVITQINNMTAGLVREDVSWGVDWGHSGDRSCVSICKRFPDGSLEIVCTEFSPYTTPQPAVPVVSEEWVKRLDEALDLTYRDDIRPARSCLLQLRKALLSAGKETVVDERVHILSIVNGNIWHTEASEKLKLAKDFELRLYADAALLSAAKENNND